MGYDSVDSFPFDSEPNGIPSGLKSKGKLSPRSYPIQFERKWKYSFLNAADVIFLHSGDPQWVIYLPHPGAPYTK